MFKYGEVKVAVYLFRGCCIGSSKGVKFVTGYYAFGEFDLCIIMEGPDNVTAASALIAAAAGGALSKIQTTVLMTAEEGLDAIKGAGSMEYRPPSA